jgi:hypothetical protein
MNGDRNLCDLSQTHNEVIATMLKDAIRFVAAFINVISHSVPHIYLSALPFAPTESAVSKRYLRRYPHTLFVQTSAVRDSASIQHILGCSLVDHILAQRQAYLLRVSRSDNQGVGCRDGERCGRPV